MPSEAAEILASALEQCASEHEQETLENMHARIAEVHRTVAPVNDIPRPTFKLAMRFWKGWAQAAQNGWERHASIAKSDWPAMARTMADSVRTGSMPREKLILDNFVRRQRSASWPRLKELFSRSS